MRARISQRTNLPRNQCSIQYKEQVIRFTGTFNAHAEEVKTLLRKHWGIMRTDPDLVEVIPSYASVTYRSGSNLRDVLVHSHLQNDVLSVTDWLRSTVIS